MIADLVAFLRARLDEDHEAARLAHTVDPAPWYEDVDYDGVTSQHDHGHGSGYVRAENDEGLWDCEGSHFLCTAADTAVHVARQHPVRILADVDAKRRIIAECRHMIRRGQPEKAQAEWILQALALPFADHPDYQAEWAPGA